MAANFRRLAHVPQMQKLRRLWEQWSEMITVLARKKRGHRKISESSYQTLHAALLETCEQCSKQFGAHLRPHFERLSRLAEPWVTTDSIRQANKQILGDLLTQCYHIERLLNPRYKLRRLRQAALFGGLAVLAGITATWLVVRLQTGDAALATHNLRLRLLRTIDNVKGAGFMEKVSIAVVVLVAFGIWALNSLRRD